MKTNRQIQKDIEALPTTPGVYFFHDADGATLYIGKASSLRARVKSYFSQDVLDTRGPLIAELVDRVSRISCTETDSVLEAVILEAQLIKQHQPYFNTKEKDNKSFNYVIITKEAFPRIFTMRERELAVGNFPFTIAKKFGPFPSGSILKEALKIIRRIFPFRDRQAGQAVTERFYRQLGLTPQTGTDAAKKRYRQTIRNLTLFFEGKKTAVINRLRKQMHAHVTNQEFEEAARVRDQLFALEHIQDIALLKREEGVGDGMRIEGYDVAHLQGASMVGVMVVVVDGVAEKASYRTFTIKSTATANDTQALKEILMRRLSHGEWDMPKLIVVDGGVPQRNAALDVLNQYGVTIPVVAVVKDERHKPKNILGDQRYIRKHESAILLANSEAHRFSLSLHRRKQRKNLIG